MSDPDPLEDLLGASPAFEELKGRARQILSRARAGARLPPILIQGETGSGKGLLARALHRAGPRSRGPFVAVNCGAIPETLGESELFGFARGAHSEARRPKSGYFVAADHGVIFLDEVGLLSEGHQARLLKIVEDRQVVPVGSTTPVPRADEDDFQAPLTMFGRADDLQAPVTSDEFQAPLERDECSSRAAQPAPVA